MGSSSSFTVLHDLADGGRGTSMALAGVEDFPASDDLHLEGKGSEIMCGSWVLGGILTP